MELFRYIARLGQTRETYSKSSPEPSLPQEILDKICDQVDVQRWKSLSLTSRRFLHRTRTHLFRKIVIKCSQLGGVGRLVHGNPSLLAHVREVTIRDLDNHSSEIVSELQPMFSQMLKYLVDIHILELCSIGLQVRWEHLAGWVHILVSQLLSFEGLRCIKLLSIQSFPIQLLAGVSNLRSLRLESVTFNGEAIPPESTDVFSRHITHLDCASRRGQTSSAELVLPPVPPALLYGNLVYLKLSVSPTLSQATVWSVLRNEHLSRALEILSIRFVLQTEPVLESENPLPSLPRLHHFALSVSPVVNVDSPRRTHHLPILASQLLQDREYPSLHTIVMSLTWPIWMCGTDSFVVNHEGGWGSLDGALSDTVALPVLHTVRLFNLFRMLPHDPRYDIADAALTRAMSARIKPVMRKAPLRLRMFDLGLELDSESAKPDRYRSSVLDAFLPIFDYET